MLLGVETSSWRATGDAKRQPHIDVILQKQKNSAAPCLGSSTSTRGKQLPDSTSSDAHKATADTSAAWKQLGSSCAGMCGCSNLTHFELQHSNNDAEPCHMKACVVVIHAAVKQHYGNASSAARWQLTGSKAQTAAAARQAPASCCAKSDEG
jgi:hypothetical protein